MSYSIEVKLLLVRYCTRLFIKTIYYFVTTSITLKDLHQRMLSRITFTEGSFVIVRK